MKGKQIQWVNHWQWARTEDSIAYKLYNRASRHVMSSTFARWRRLHLRGEAPSPSYESQETRRLTPLPPRPTSIQTRPQREIPVCNAGISKPFFLTLFSFFHGTTPDLMEMRRAVAAGIADWDTSTKTLPLTHSLRLGYAHSHPMGDHLPPLTPSVASLTLTS